MAEITGSNIYIDGIKRNPAPVPLTGTFYLSDWKQAGDFFDIQASYVFSDGTESERTPVQTHKLLVPNYTADTDANAYLDAIGVPTDDTPYFYANNLVVTGEQTRYAYSKFVMDLKAAGVYSKLRLLYPAIGGTQTTVRVNAINPTVTAEFLSFSGVWAYTDHGALPNSQNESASMDKTLNNFTGLAANSITVGVWVQSIGKDTALWGPQIGLVGNATSRVAIGAQRNAVYAGLTKDHIAHTHNRNLDKVNLLATIQSDNVQRIYMDGVLEKTTAAQNGSLPITNPVGFFSLHNNPGRCPTQVASFHMLGTGMTNAEALAYQGAVAELCDFLHRDFSSAIPQAVFHPAMTTLDSVYWPIVYKSVDWPEITTTKPYFCIYSTDHSSKELGGIAWAECDDPMLNGFVERGIIIQGDQAETPWLIRVPSAKSGVADELFLFYHISVIRNQVQQQHTRLITTSGGPLHTATWTSRGGDVLGFFNDDNHTGYARFWYRPATDDFLANHLGTDGTTGAKTYLSTSSHPITGWTRLVQTMGTENMPEGVMWMRNQLCKFERGGVDYAFVGLRYANGLQRVWLYRLDANLIPLTPVRVVTDFFSIRTLTHYDEGNTAWLYIKGGSNTERFGTTYAVQVDISDL